MKKIIICIAVFISFFVVCEDKPKNVMARNVLIKAELTSHDEYLIVCRGFPKEGITNQIQRILTAKEAALLNAQILARERFLDSLDVIRHGLVKKYRERDDYVEIYYIVKHKDVKKFLK